MRTALHSFILTVAIACSVSCSCTRGGTSAPDPQFYSGSLQIDQTGRASYTDCATRIEMEIQAEGEYEKLRRDYANSTADDGEPARIEFFGRIVGSPATAMEDTTDRSSVYSPAVQIRIDSILSLTDQPACLTDYIVAGFYRRVYEGQAEILRLRPDYSYSIENFTTGNTPPLTEGVWYRTSELTLELREDINGMTTRFQIVPARESISGTGKDGEAVVYKKEWL